MNLETLQLFRRAMGPHSRLDDPDVVHDFLKRVSDSLAGNKTNGPRLKGIRTQALFAQLILAMDGCELMLTVDAGDIYTDGFISSGDFLLTLRDGRRLLVEVKTVSRSYNGNGKINIERSANKSLRAKEVNGLRRAATLLGAEPFYAAYYEFVDHWALIRLEDLTPKGSNYTLKFSQDMVRNHMGDLGDRSIGVEPPIEIRSYPRAGHEPDLGAASEEGLYSVRIDRRTVHVGGKLITDPKDAEFAKFLGLYGHWAPKTVPAILGNKISYVSLYSEPEEPVEGQGFQIIGPLSYLFSRYFMVHTINNNRKPTALDIEATPSLIADFLARAPRDRQFPTWQFNMKPASTKASAGHSDR